MDPIEQLRQEHEDIERELVELETIMEAENINHPNLRHVFRNLCSTWNHHEEKEEKIFSVMKKERIRVPVYTMRCEHRDLRAHREAIDEAILSRNEFKIKNILEERGKIMIAKLRKHINNEEEVLYTITLEEFTPKEIEELWKDISL